MAFENFSRAISSVGQYRFQSGQARARGIQQRSEALQQAYSLETEAEKNSFLAMLNMMAMRKNQTSAEGAALTQSGASGFMASTGSQRANQAEVAAAWEQEIANANKSNVIADENARMQAAAYRRYGDNAVTMANIEADYYSGLAAASKRSRWGYLLGDSLMLGGQMMMTYGGGEKAGDKQKKEA